MHRLFLPFILLVVLTSQPLGGHLFQPDPQPGLVTSVLDVPGDASEPLEFDDVDAAYFASSHLWPLHRPVRKPFPVHDVPNATQNNKVLIRAPPLTFS